MITIGDDAGDDFVKYHVLSVEIMIMLTMVTDKIKDGRSHIFILVKKLFCEMHLFFRFVYSIMMFEFFKRNGVINNSKNQNKTTNMNSMKIT